MKHRKSILTGIAAGLIAVTLTFTSRGVAACPQITAFAEEVSEEEQQESVNSGAADTASSEEEVPEALNEYSAGTTDENAVETTNEDPTEGVSDQETSAPSAAKPRRIIRNPDEAPAMRTYEFYSDSDYKTMVDSQTVKNGEYLTEPSKPEKSGSVFIGWSTDEGETMLSFGEDHPITDIAGENGSVETVRVCAVFEQKYTVTFHDTDNSIIKVENADNSSISVDDVTFNVLDGYYVSAWTTDPQGSEEGKITNTLSKESVEEMDSDKDGNLDLYPIVKGVCWIVFDDSLDEADTRSSYVEPVYIKAGEKISRPETDPSRPGYQFKGWSTKKNAGASDFFDFDTPVTENTVLYAQWETQETTYTIQVMMEKLVDHKYVPGNYAVAGEYKVNGEKPKAQTGTVLNPSSDSSGKAANIPTEQELTTWFDSDEANIENSTYWDFDHIEQDVPVKGDGSTILHVYFKMHEFQVRAGLSRLMSNGTRRIMYTPYVWTVDAEAAAAVSDIEVTFNGKTYKVGENDDFSFTARYGESLEGKLPQLTDITVHKKQGVSPSGLDQYNWYNNVDNCNGVRGWWLGGNNVSSSLSYMTTALIPSSYTRGSKAAVSIGGWFWYPLTFGTLHTMLENPDDDGFTDNVKNNAYTHNVHIYAGEIKGFTHYSPEDTTVEANSAAPEGYQDRKTDTEKAEYCYYYIRDRYALRIYNHDQLLAEYNSDDKTSENAKIKWGASLKKYAVDGTKLTRPTGIDDAYQFLGWYTTEDCQEGTEFNIETDVMPMNNLTLYAKWGVPDVHVTFDLDGGTSDSISDTPVAVTYGTTVPRPAAPTKDGYLFAGWEYSDTGKMFNFSTKLFADTTLKARWTNQTTFKVIYDAGEGSVEPVDSKKYENGSGAIVLGAPSVVPEGKYFYGWQFADGNVYQKGNVLTVRAEYTEPSEEGQYQIILTAVYGDKQPGTTLIYNPNGGSGDPYIVSADNNVNLKLVDDSVAGFSRVGYKFIGWNTKPDGDGDSYKAGDTVVVDRQGTDDMPNILYAQWKETKYTVTYIDGVDDAEVFKDDVHSDIPAGADTPGFAGGTPVRDGYTFAGWTPAVSETVTGDATYTASWTKASKEEPENPVTPVTPTTTYTVTYTDGVNNSEVFKDQVFSDLTSGTKTPAFNGTPTRDGYKFKGWTPTVAETVTDNATYTAIWEKVSKEETTTPVTPVTPTTPDNPATAGTTTAPATTDKKDTSKEKTDTAKGDTTPSTVAPNKDNGTAQNANASSKTANSPGTGDESHPMIYVLGVLAAAAVLAAVIAVMRRRHRFDER